MNAKHRSMTDVYNPEAFGARVDYAAQCLVRGIRSRRFGTCFEMYDGDAVAVALIRRARNNPRLKEAISRGWDALDTEGFPESWARCVDGYKNIPTTQLPTLARALRLKATGGDS